MLCPLAEEAIQGKTVELHGDMMAKRTGLAQSGENMTPAQS
jgi:hypothetical protein